MCNIRQHPWQAVTGGVASALMFLAACRPAQSPSQPSAGADSARQAEADPAPSKGAIMLSSNALQPGEAIPKKYTGEGTDVSPPLAWSDVPPGTKSWALICDDPDAPSAKSPGPEPWVHWVIFNIPADARQLPEGIARDANLADPAGAKQGRNSWPSDNIGYRGPLPPPSSGPHRYFFKLYALDTMLSADPANTDKKSLLAAIKDHVLAESQLMGTYERQ